MRRLAIHLLLAALALPYARAALCQAGSHEHAQHHETAGLRVIVEAPGEGADPEADCHALMGCAVALQASLPSSARIFRALPQESNALLSGAASRLRSNASPDTPPPKTA